jgi:hypothetical protein
MGVMNADNYCQSRLPLSSPDNMRIFDKHGSPVAWVDATAGTLGMTTYLIRVANGYGKLQEDNDRLRMELETANVHRQQLLKQNAELLHLWRLGMPPKK